MGPGRNRRTPGYVCLPEPGKEVKQAGEVVFRQVKKEVRECSLSFLLSCPSSPQAKFPECTIEYMDGRVGQTIPGVEGAGPKVQKDGQKYAKFISQHRRVTDT